MGQWVAILLASALGLGLGMLFAFFALSSPSAASPAIPASIALTVAGMVGSITAGVVRKLEERVSALERRQLQDNQTERPIS
jgi:hypothetical protein